MQKVFLYGIDGATWDVINPLIEKGKLPNLKRLIEDGVSGILKSLDPPVSPMVWTSIATGKLPSKHGVRDFIVNSESVRTKRIWNILQEKGWKIGLMDYLVTWPPEKVNGFCVPSHFAQGTETYPRELEWLNKLLIESKKEEKLSLRRKFSYVVKFLTNGVTFNTLMNVILFQVSKSLRKLNFYDYFYPVRKIKIAIRSDILISLSRKFKVDFIAYINNIVDATSHNYWKFYKPEEFSKDLIKQDELKKYESFLPDAYIESDKLLGKILRVLDDNSVLMVASDHGFQANTREASPFSLTMRSGNIAKHLDLNDDFRYFNIGSSVVFSSVLGSEEAEDTLKKKLLEFKLLESGIPIFRIRENSLYNLILRLNEEINISEDTELKVITPDEKICKLKEFLRSSGQAISGEHHLDGIIIMKGPMFKKGVEIEGASVLDLMPTLLFSLKLPLAKDFDGKIIKEAFREDFVRENKANTIESYDADWEYEEDDSQMKEELKERLEKLGYL